MQTAPEAYESDLSDAAAYWEEGRTADLLTFTGGAPGATAELALHIWDTRSPEKAREFLEWIGKHSVR